jgi:hypothetical protein
MGQAPAVLPSDAGEGSLRRPSRAQPGTPEERSLNRKTWSRASDRAMILGRGKRCARSSASFWSVCCCTVSARLRQRAPEPPRRLVPVLDPPQGRSPQPQILPCDVRLAPPVLNPADPGVLIEAQLSAWLVDSYTRSRPIKRWFPLVGCDFNTGFHSSWFPPLPSEATGSGRLAANSHLSNTTAGVTPRQLLLPMSPERIEKFLLNTT